MKSRLSLLCGLAAFWPALAAACSLGELQARATASLETFQESEFEEQESRAVEGSAWHAYSTADGQVHSITVTFYHEGSQRQERISFLNKREFVIVSRILEYNRRLFSDGNDHIPLEFLMDETEHYYFCGNDVYIPYPAGTDEVRPVPETQSHLRWPIDRRDSLVYAREMRDLFFTAPETAPYIAKVPD